MEREWRKGFPKHTQGLGGYHLFELRLTDLLESNKVIEAYIKEDGLWHDNETRKVIPAERIAGWRETFTCQEARLAIDEYVRKGGFGISKHNFHDALSRHIKMDSDEYINCEKCWQYFLLKTGQEYSLPSPEELLKVKQFVLSAT